MTTEYSEGAISFAEYKDPITNEIAAVLMDRPGGRQAVVAYIHEGYDPNAKKKVYRTYDVDGKEIIPANYNLKFLKKEIQRKEDWFHEQTALKEQALQQDFATGERQRLKELRTIRSGRTKSHSRTR